MAALNVRVDSATAAFLDRIARETGRSKSDVVREALAAMRDQLARPVALPPIEAMAHLIGSWDSGGARLSERTGEQFARLLQEKHHGHRANRRRTARRTD